MFAIRLPKRKQIAFENHLLFRLTKKYWVALVDKNSNTLFLQEQFSKNTGLIFARNLRTNYKQCQPQQQNKPKTNEKKLKSMKKTQFGADLKR